MKKNSLKLKEKNRMSSFLWEVKGGDAKMFLKGTVHMLPKGFFPLKDEIMKRFYECRNLVLEVILDDGEDNAIKITDDIIYSKDYTYEDGDSLYNHFPRERVMNLRNYLVKNNLCSPDLAKKFYKLKPEVINALVANGIYNNAGIDKENMGIDKYLMNRARELNKNILELESKEFQEELIDTVFNKGEANKNNEDEKSKSLNNESKKDKKSQLSILDTNVFWRFINLKMYPKRLNSIAKKCGKMYSDEKKIAVARKIMVSTKSPLVGDRDEEMFKKLKELLKNKDSYFVAVGAAHLIGEGSIIDRLKESGYEIVRIC